MKNKSIVVLSALSVLAINACGRLEPSQQEQQEQQEQEEQIEQQEQIDQAYYIIKLTDEEMIWQRVDNETIHQHFVNSKFWQNHPEY